MQYVGVSLDPAGDFAWSTSRPATDDVALKGRDGTGSLTVTVLSEERMRKLMQRPLAYLRGVLMLKSYCREIAAPDDLVFDRELPADAWIPELGEANELAATLCSVMYFSIGAIAVTMGDRVRGGARENVRTLVLAGPSMVAQMKVPPGDLAAHLAGSPLVQSDGETMRLFDALKNSLIETGAFVDIMGRGAVSKYEIAGGRVVQSAGQLPSGKCIVSVQFGYGVVDVACETQSEAETRGMTIRAMLTAVYGNADSTLDKKLRVYALRVLRFPPPPAAAQCVSIIHPEDGGSAPKFEERPLSRAEIVSAKTTPLRFLDMIAAHHGDFSTLSRSGGGGGGDAPKTHRRGREEMAGAGIKKPPAGVARTPEGFVPLSADEVERLGIQKTRGERLGFAVSLICDGDETKNKMVVTYAGDFESGVPARVLFADGDGVLGRPMDTIFHNIRFELVRDSELANEYVVLWDHVIVHVSMLRSVIRPLGGHDLPAFRFAGANLVVLTKVDSAAAEQRSLESFIAEVGGGGA